MKKLITRLALLAFIAESQQIADIKKLAKESKEKREVTIETISNYVLNVMISQGQSDESVNFPETDTEIKRIYQLSVLQAFLISIGGEKYPPEDIVETPIRMLKNLVLTEIRNNVTLAKNTSASASENESQEFFNLYADKFKGVNFGVWESKKHLAVARAIRNIVIAKGLGNEKTFGDAIKLVNSIGYSIVVVIDGKNIKASPSKSTKYLNDLCDIILDKKNEIPCIGNYEESLIEALTKKEESVPKVEVSKQNQDDQE